MKRMEMDSAMAQPDERQDSTIEERTSSTERPDSRQNSQNSFILSILAFLVIDGVLAVCINNTPIFLMEFVVVALGGLSLGQFSYATLIAGLWGRSWIAGYMLAIALAVCAIFVFTIAYGWLDYLKYGMAIDYSMLVIAGTALPAVLLLSTLPWFLLRSLRGWRLTRDAKVVATSQDSGAILDLFVTTAIAAAAIMCVQAGGMFYPDSTSGGSDMVIGLLTSGGVMAAVNALLVAPFLWCFFACRTSGRRLVFVGSSVALLAIGSIAVVLSANTLLFQSVNMTPSTLWSPAGFSLFAALPIVIGGYTLRWSGYRIASLRDLPAMNRPGPATGSDLKKTEESPLDDTDEQETVVPQEQSAKMSHYRFAGICFCLLFSVCLMGVVVSSRRSDHMREILAIDSLLQSSGGKVLQLSEAREIYDLEVVSDKEVLRELLTTADLSEIQGLKIVTDSLSDLDFILVENIDYLTKLDLSETDLRDEDLDRLDLDKLHWIDVSGTQLTSKGVKRLASLMGLRHLRIGNLEVNPEELGSVLPDRRMDSLRIGGSSFNNAQLQGLLSQTQIPGELDLSDSNIDSDALSNLTCDNLILDGTAISDKKFSQWLGKASSFGNKLSLARTQLTDAILPKLSKSRWSEIDLSGSLVTDQGLSSISPTSWSALKISSPEITGSFLHSWVKTSTSVFTLDLSNSGAGDEAMRAASKLPSLQNIDLSNTKISAAAIVALCDSNQYREVKISGCEIDVEPLLDVSLGTVVLYVDVGQFTEKELKNLRTKFTVRVGLPLGN